MKNCMKILLFHVAAVAAAAAFSVKKHNLNSCMAHLVRIKKNLQIKQFNKFQLCILI